MIDSPSTPLAVIHSAIHRLAAQSASCKLWSVGIAVLALLVYSERGGSSALLWLAAPAALLGLLDAACVVEARRLATLGWNLSTKDRTDPGKVAEVMRNHVEGPGYPAVLKGLSGVFSFSVWPYYLGLAGVIVATGHSGALTPVPTPAPGLPAAPKAARPFGSPQMDRSRPQYQNSPLAANPMSGRSTTGMPQYSGGGQRPTFTPPNYLRTTGVNPTGIPVMRNPNNPFRTPIRPTTPPSTTQSKPGASPALAPAGALPGPFPASPAPGASSLATNPRGAPSSAARTQPSPAIAPPRDSSQAK